MGTKKLENKKNKSRCRRTQNEHQQKKRDKQMMRATLIAEEGGGKLKGETEIKVPNKP